MTSSKSRDYQIQGKNELRELIRKGYKRILWWMPTGTGKTFCFIDLANSLLGNNKKVLVVMRRRELIFQTAASIFKFTKRKCSVIMGTEKGFDPSLNIQVCSIDTIIRRLEKPEYAFLLQFDWVLVDEAHDTTSNKYQEFLDKFKHAIWIGYSATLFNTGKRYLSDVGWQTYVCPITAREARDRGYLVPEKTYAPAKIDTKGIKLKGNDFDQKSLAERASESKIVGDIVATWLKYGDNRPTILFAVNKDHSKIMAEAFRQKGIEATHQDESHSSEERQNAIEGLKSGVFKILCNVNIFSTGVDIPQAGCGVFARPTKSEILYVQQVGRLLRPFKRCRSCQNDQGAENVCARCGSTEFYQVKQNAILLDHANNCEQFGLAYDDRHPRITPPENTKKKVIDPDLEIKTKTCEACYAVYSVDESSCPYCEHVNAKTERQIKKEEGELRRVKSEQLRYAKYIQIKNDLMKLSNRKWKPSATWIRLHAIHGDLIFDFRKELEIPRWAKAQITKLTKKAPQSSINS